MMTGDDTVDGSETRRENPPGIYTTFPRDPITERQRMSVSGCIITEPKRKVVRFHAPILRFGEPGSLGLVNNGISTTNLNWVIFRRISSTISSNNGCVSFPASIRDLLDCLITQEVTNLDRPMNPQVWVALRAVWGTRIFHVFKISIIYPLAYLR